MSSDSDRYDFKLCARRELLANLSPADLESYQPMERRAIHCLLRNLLSSPDNFEQQLRQ
jgi:hypothetical protein